MVEQLFGSKTRVKLLQLFYSNPNRSFYVREITRKIDEQINSVRRELGNLLSIGIITSDTTNNKLYYEVNQNYEFYPPLRQIFGGKQANKTAVQTMDTVLDENAVVSAAAGDLKTIGHVELAVFTGQFTRDDSTGVDILIIGDVNPTALSRYIEQLEKTENKSLRYTTMTIDDFKYRQQIRDRFAVAIDKAKKQVLVDTNYLLTTAPPAPLEEPAEAETPKKKVTKG